MAPFLTFVQKNWLAFTVLFLVMITTLSLWPLGKLPDVPGTDKTHHFIAYGALMFPTALRKSNNWILIGLFFIAFSGVIELVQPYVNRYGEWLDMAANTAGVVCGLLVAKVVIYFSSDDSKNP